MGKLLQLIVLAAWLYSNFTIKAVYLVALLNAIPDNWNNELLGDIS